MLAPIKLGTPPPGVPLFRFCMSRGPVCPRCGVSTRECRTWVDHRPDALPDGSPPESVLAYQCEACNVTYVVSGTKEQPFCDQCQCDQCVTGKHRDFRVRSAIDGSWWCDVCYLDDAMADDFGPAPPWVQMQCGPRSGSGSVQHGQCGDDSCLGGWAPRVCALPAGHEGEHECAEGVRWATPCEDPRETLDGRHVCWLPQGHAGQHESAAGLTWEAQPS